MKKLKNLDGILYKKLGQMLANDPIWNEDALFRNVRESIIAERVSSKFRLTKDEARLALKKMGLKKKNRFKF